MSGTRRTFRARHAIVAVGALLVIGFGAVAHGASAGAAPAQDDDPSVTETTAVGEIPATESPAAESPATTAVPSTTVANALKDRATDSEDATTRLNRVVLALIFLAVVIAVATVVFWRMTRPDRRAPSRSGAHWVGGDGDPVPIEDSDPIGLGDPLADAPPVAVDTSAWAVAPAPRLPPDEGTGRDRLPVRSPGVGPSPDPPGVPVVVVESVDGPVRPRGIEPPDVEAPGGAPSARWASQGWGGGSSTGDPSSAG